MATFTDGSGAGLPGDGRDLRRSLRAVLAINVFQAAAGIAVGLWAASTAVIGVALDNLSDSAVYAVSLYALGRSTRAKVRAARLSGWLLIGLAVALLVEVLRRFFGGEEPVGPAMMAVAGFNFAVNLVCLRLLSRHEEHDINAKASAIFTSNDSLANLGIVVSAALVMWLGTNLPDLVLGIVVAGVAAHGGKEILEIAQEARESEDGGD